MQVFGFDGTADGLKAVESGTMLGTIAQQPKELGRKAVRAAYDLIRNKKVEKIQSIAVKTVTKENVADFK